MSLIAVDKFEPAIAGNKVLNAEYIDWGEGGTPSGAYVGSVNSSWVVSSSDYTYSGTIKNGTVFILTFASSVTSGTQKLYFYNSSTSQNDGYNMKYQSSSAAGALNGKISAGETCIFTFDGTDLKFVSKDSASGLMPQASSSKVGGIKIGYTASGNNIPLQLSSGKGYVSLPQSSNSASGIVQLSDSGTISADIANNVDNKAVTPKAISSSIDGSVSSHFWIGTATEYSQITPVSGVIYSIYDV